MARTLGRTRSWKKAMESIKNGANTSVQARRAEKQSVNVNHMALATSVESEKATIILSLSSRAT